MSEHSNLYMTDVLKIVTADLNYKRDTNEGCFSVDETIFNNTEFPITLIRRDNIAFTSVKNPHTNADNTDLFIRRTYKIRGLHNIRQVTNNLFKYMEKYGNQSVLVKDMHLGLLAYLNTTNWNNNLYFQFVFDLKINTAELIHQKKAYYRDLDLLFVVGEYKEEHVHPFSSEGVGWSRYQEALEKTNVSGVFLEIVDNESLISKRYIFLAKQVLEVPIVKDNTRDSGVYFNVVKSDNINKGVILQKRYGFEEAQNIIGLYSTTEDALSGGDPKRLLDSRMQEKDLELSDLRRQLEVEKIESTRLREQLDLKKAQREEALQERQASRTIQVEQTKDRFEERSVKRKDRSEMIKMIGTAVVTGLSVAAIMSRKK